MIISMVDWQQAIIMIIALIVILVALCGGGLYFMRHHEIKKNEKRDSFVHDVLSGHYNDEQVIKFMGRPIGPKMDISLIHAVASSKMLTPRLRAWIMKKYPVALASRDDLSDDEIIKLAGIDDSSIDSALLRSGRRIPVEALRLIADTEDSYILNEFHKHPEYTQDAKTEQILENSRKNVIGF